jgi:phage FluMu protein Com
MPIRFRCAYCNQLLGIARRKAGSVVRCPTCAGHVVVPNLPADETEGSDKNGNQSIFERSDFDDLLNPQGPQPAAVEQREQQVSSGEVPVVLSSVAEPPPGAWGTHAEPPYDVERLKPSPSGIAAAEPIAQPLGLVLSPRRVRIVIISGVIALLLAFSVGLLVGHFMWTP